MHQTRLDWSLLLYISSFFNGSIYFNPFKTQIQTRLLCHLLMVSSSSESQKLVVSSSLLIIVLELSYPARWRSNRLWPFMRGPDRWQENFPSSFKSTWPHFFSEDDKHLSLINLRLSASSHCWGEAEGSHNLFLSSAPWAVFFPLTVLLHALSVPRSLPPEGNDWLRLRLVVQGFHAARRIGTKKHTDKWAFIFFLLLKVATHSIATHRLQSKISLQAFALTVRPHFSRS